MKLQQLRYLVAIADNGLNITAASEQLYTSQPGVSKQLKLLEEELGLRLFSRSGKTLDAVTDAGQMVIDKARNILREAEEIKNLASELTNEQIGVLSIGTTHTQARYVLPDILREFRKRYPDLQFNLHQGSNDQIEEWVKSGYINFAIASASTTAESGMVTLPCYHWDQALIFPQTHPLAKLNEVTLQDLVEYPIVTYSFSSTDRSSLLDAFHKEGLEPQIAITVQDADVIKTYVKEGLGIGFIASMAYDPVEDADLCAVSTNDLLPTYSTWIGFREEDYIRSYMYDFIQLFAPHLDKYVVDEAVTEYRQKGKITCIDESKLPYLLIQTI